MSRQCCCNCGGIPPQLRVGDTLYGFCGGAFGRDSYGDKTVEYIGIARGKQYVVVSEDGWWNDELDRRDVWLHLWKGDPSELVEYTVKQDDD